MTTDFTQTEKYKDIIEERFGVWKYGGKRQHDSPDGEDLLGKLFWYTKYAGVVGIAAGCMENILLKRSKLRDLTFTVAKYAAPAVGLATVFVVTTHYAARYREKQDFYNHFYGGLGVGATAGALLGSIGKGIALAIIIGPSLALIERDYQHPSNHRNQNKKMFSAYLQRKLDTSLVEPRKGNWVKAEPPQSNE